MANKGNGKGSSDNLVAIALMCGVFALLIVSSMMTQDDPVAFMASFLGTIVAYLFILLFIFGIIGIIIFYYRIADADPNKSLRERARDSLEISKETSSEISQYIKKFYADYQDRKKAAEDEKKNSNDV